MWFKGLSNQYTYIPYRKQAHFTFSGFDTTGSGWQACHVFSTDSYSETVHMWFRFWSLQILAIRICSTRVTDIRIQTVATIPAFHNMQKVYSKKSKNQCFFGMDVCVFLWSSTTLFATICHCSPPGQQLKIERPIYRLPARGTWLG